MSKAQQTRAMLIQSAYELFVENGYHGTSMRQIAERSGLALGGIYNHFKGKEEIFLGVIEAYHPFISIMPALSQIQANTFPDYVHQFAQQFTTAFNAHPGMLKLVFIELVELEGKHITPMLAKLMPQLGQILARFNDSNNELRDLDPIFLFRNLIGMLMGQGLMRLILHDPAHPLATHRSVEELVDLYLHGVMREL
jgi:AcrR family transcriptional regulator